jgi:lipopolysaccharide transport system permease protein
VVRRLWTHRSLVLSLARRQYQIRYRQSFIGLAWALIVPLATLGVGVIVFKRIAGLDTGQGSYALGTLAALVPWSFFASSLSFGVGSVVQDRSIVTKLSFPRAALPLGAVGSSMIDLTIAAAIFVGLAVITGAGLPLTSLWVPLLLIVEVALTAGLVLLGSAINVFARDIRLAVPLLVQFWLFLTPVMYPLSSVEGLRTLYLLNPMTGIVESFRRVLVLGQPPDPSFLVPSLIGAGTALVLGAWYFAGTEARFADVA